MSNDRVLKYYDLARKLVLEFDASGVGAGFTLLQNFSVDLKHDTHESFLTAEFLANLLPIAYGSQTCIDYEKHYGNIKRELLAVVHGIEFLLIKPLEGAQLFFLTISHCLVSFSKT